MKLIIKTVFCLIISVLFFSCSTVNKAGLDDYTRVSDSTMFDATGNVIIKRDSGFMGSAVSAFLYVDKKFCCRLSPGTFCKIRLHKGSHFLSVTSAKVLNLGKEFNRSLRVDITDETEIRTFRVFPMPTQGIVIEEIME